MSIGKFNSMERRTDLNPNLTPIEERIAGMNNATISEQLENFDRAKEEIDLVEEIIRQLERKGGFSQDRLCQLLSEMENEDGEIEHPLLSSPKDTGRIGKMVILSLERKKERERTMN